MSNDITESTTNLMNMQCAELERAMHRDDKIGVLEALNALRETIHVVRNEYVIVAPVKERTILRQCDVQTTSECVLPSGCDFDEERGECTCLS